MRSVPRMLLATTLTLLFCEGALRMANHGPCTRFNFDGLPTISQADGELGWVNRPVHIAGMTIDADGERGVTSSKAPITIGLYGGSFVFGFGLSDLQIVSTHLAAARPEVSVHNRGVPGYGTVQAGLLSARHAEHTVFYGLVELHDGRNAAAWSWLHALNRSTDNQAWAATPAAWWDGTTLQRSGPIAYQHWGLSERSALVNLVENTWIELHDRMLRSKAETTIRLIVEWRDQVEARGGRFVVGILNAPTRLHFYQHRLEAQGVTVLDLTVDVTWTQDDGHPDERAHQVWGEQLARWL